MLIIFSFIFLNMNHSDKTNLTINHQRRDGALQQPKSKGGSGNKNGSVDKEHEHKRCGVTTQDLLPRGKHKDTFYEDAPPHQI